MSSTVQVGKRTFTTDAICEQLTSSDLLPQLLREMIIDEILADWDVEIDGKIPYNREEFTEGCDRLGRLAGYQGLNQLQLYKIVDRHLRLQKFKHTRWSSRVYSHYLQRKSSFDRVKFSLIQVDDRGLAEELYFRVQRGEQSFSDLAFRYSQGDSAKDGGRVTAIDIDRTHPEIVPYLRSLKEGEISAIFTLNNLHTFVRSEGSILAELDDSLNQILIDELFEKWVQQKIAERLGLFEIEDVINTHSPELNYETELPDVEPELLELIGKMDEQPERSQLLEPTASFFFPKEIPESNYDFEDVVPSSSFFYPKDSPTQLICKSRSAWDFQRIVSFILLFSIFLGIEVVTLKMFNRLDIPQLNVGSARIP
ncbi:peptidylprolyl isomerase [Chamaesiphon sp. VAR_48_metabat_135_sub]|uniref:peptidylprolyl isomerase n=1 Tax=Chamaesiphon sp. VAR_48_metabat_135_sub TaxID=2964699 RepID=UPI00286B495A|nr:peptidylprolyl isomerase [Chamaesiphon sp. VAR_48_metabat_135_sub]